MEILGAIIVALITGGLALVGTIISCNANSKKTDLQIQIGQAETKVKIEELTREVREHNNFAKRMPVVEEQIKTIHKRLEKIESKEQLCKGSE